MVDCGTELAAIPELSLNEIFCARLRKGAEYKEDGYLNCEYELSCLLDLSVHRRLPTMVRAFRTTPVLNRAARIYREYRITLNIHIYEARRLREFFGASAN